MNIYDLNKYLNLNPLNSNPTKWSDKLKQFVDNFLSNCLSVFDHFMLLAVKGLNKQNISSIYFFKVIDVILQPLLFFEFWGKYLTKVFHKM